MKGLYFIQMIVSDDYADRRQSVRYNNARELKQDIIMHGVSSTQEEAELILDELKAQDNYPTK